MKNYNLGMLKAAGWAAACAIGLALPASAAVDFLGVAAGDASNTEATLWTRAVDPNAPAVVALTAQVSTNYDFGSGVVTYAVATDAAKDFTAKVTATGLSPGTRYYYRFTDGSGYSPAGTFKTAPDAGAAVPVSTVKAVPLAVALLPATSVLLMLGV